jgi:hypothetical protein
MHQTRILTKVAAILVCLALNAGSMTAYAGIGKGHRWRSRCYPSTRTCQAQATTSVTVLPLCPRLAQLSYETREAGNGKLVGSFLQAAADARGIQIQLLSSFVAEFRGPPHQIRWLEQNYAMLLCAFNSALVIDDQAVYTSAMNHAEDWIALVREGRHKDLMLSQYKFCNNCCVSGVGN